MVRFTIYLEIIEQESLVNAAIENGKYLLQQLTILQDEFPDIVSNARGRGLFCAFDLPNTQSRDDLASTLIENKVIVLGSGEKSIRFRPHLNIKKEEINIGINACLLYTSPSPRDQRGSGLAC